MQQAHVPLLALVQLKVVENKKHSYSGFIEKDYSKIQEFFWRITFFKNISCNSENQTR